MTETKKIKQLTDRMDKLEEVIGALGKHFNIYIIKDDGYKVVDRSEYNSATWIAAGSDKPKKKWYQFWK